MPSGAHSLASASDNPLDRKFGGVVIAYPREADQTAHGRDIDDYAASPIPHERQYGLRHVGEAEDVHLKHGADLIVLAFFHGRQIAVARIIHKDIDLTEAGNSVRYSPPDLVGVCDI